MNFRNRRVVVSGHRWSCHFHCSTWEMRDEDKDIHCVKVHLWLNEKIYDDDDEVFAFLTTYCGS